MRRLLPFLLAACACLVAAPAAAQIPQTIVIDGLNDFDAANLVEDDTLDTETKAWCTSTIISPMDIGRFYLTNDNNFLYIGLFNNPGDPPDDCFSSPQPNIGFAIDVNTPGGNTTDAFGRKLAWNLVPKKPDFYAYLVLDGFNYEVLYQNNAGSWDVVAGDASDGLGARGEDTHFIELRLPLATLGVSAGDTINIESWWTQDASQKGPLDALCSDAVQLSTPGGTTFDTANDIEMTNMKTYAIQAFVDNIPPTVEQARAVNFPLLGDKTWSLTSNRIDVKFSEPVDLGTAQTAGNYVISGAASPLVILAQRDATDQSLVHLTLSTPISANAAFYDVTVSNVQDQNTNVIGAGNVGSFFVQNVIFENDTRAALCQGSVAATDTFSVEGSIAPLTFTLCDNTWGYDGDVDSIYTSTLPLSIPKDAGTGKAEVGLQWKWARNCTEFEGGANHQVTVSSDSGSTAHLRTSWSNQFVEDYTRQAIDVIFQVDMSMEAPGPADTVYLQGSEAPLQFDPAGFGNGVIMLDDGVAPDVSAGDDIYTARVTFPVCTYENVNWKIFYQGVFECEGQGDRNVFLNDELFSSSNPIVLPARKFDRCSVTDKPISVIFRVDMTAASPQPAAGDTVGIGGFQLPLDFDQPWLATMADDGIAPDQVAGDKIYALSVTFPDSTERNVEFKHWLGYLGGGGGAFECFGVGNRTLQLDDVNYSTSTPQMIQSAWDYCQSNVGVPLPPLAIETTASFAILKQSFPNPFSPRTTIRFDLKRAGHVTLRVYDISGRHVRTLMDKELVVGPHEAQWTGIDARGHSVQAGIYIYELALGDERMARRMVYTK